MNFIRFIGPDGFGVQIAAVAALVVATEILLYRIKNVPAWVANYLPLCLAAVGTIVGDLILSGEIVFSEDLFYEGVIAYSLGSVLFVSVRKILRGENPEDALFTLVKSIAKGVCTDDAERATAKIAEIIKNLGSIDFAAAKDEIVSVLKTVANDGVPKTRIADIAEAILQSAKNFKKEK